ncbi:MAG: hypothetical protein GY838_12860 [bacterium]|nr:hypothetical protein [bacterium]
MNAAKNTNQTERNMATKKTNGTKNSEILLNENWTLKITQYNSTDDGRLVAEGILKGKGKEIRATGFAHTNRAKAAESLVILSRAAIESDPWISSL